MAAAGLSVVFRGKHEEQGSLTMKASDLGFISRISFLSALPVFPLYSPLWLSKDFTGPGLYPCRQGTEQTSLNRHGGGGGWAHRAGPESDQPKSVGGSGVK